MKLVFKRFNLPVNQLRLFSQHEQYRGWGCWDFVFDNLYRPILNHSEHIFLYGSFWKDNSKYRLGLNERLFDVVDSDIASSPPPYWVTEEMQKKVFDELVSFVGMNFNISPYGLRANSVFIETIESQQFKNIISGSDWNLWTPILYCQIRSENLDAVKKMLTKCTYSSGDFHPSERRYVIHDKQAIKLAKDGAKDGLITIQLFMNDYFIVLFYEDSLSDEINEIGGLVDSASDEYKNRLGEFFLGRSLS